MAKLIESLSTTERLRQGKSAIPSLLELQMMDVPYWRDDFMGGAHPTSWYTSLVYQSTASGTVAAAAAIQTGAANGQILLDPGTDNGGRSDLSLGLHFTGSRNAHFWWYVTLPANIGSFKFELGATDVVSGTDAGAVNAKADPTFNAENAVVLVFDTTDDTALTLAGVKATVADTVIDFDEVLAAATDYYFGIELRDDQARGYLLNADGKLLEQTAWMDDAVTSTTLLTPWAFVQNRSGSQRLFLIDLLCAYQRRSAS